MAIPFLILFQNVSINKSMYYIYTVNSEENGIFHLSALSRKLHSQNSTFSGINCPLGSLEKTCPKGHKAHRT